MKLKDQAVSLGNSVNYFRKKYYTNAEEFEDEGILTNSFCEPIITDDSLPDFKTYHKDTVIISVIDK